MGEIGKGAGSGSIYVGGRIVGEVRGGIFVKRVKASRHFLRVPPAIAFDIESLEQAQAAGAEKVKIIDTESGKIYKAFISTIWEKGFEFDRGFGKQIALLISDWSQGGEPMGKQMGLWDVS